MTWNLDLFNTIIPFDKNFVYNFKEKLLTLKKNALTKNQVYEKVKGNSKEKIDEFSVQPSNNLCFLEIKNIIYIISHTFSFE